MFIPNNSCRVQVTSGKTDVYGQPIPGNWVVEPCGIVVLVITSTRTSTRHAASGSQGSAFEGQGRLNLLLMPSTKAQIDGVVELDGYHFKIDSKQPRYDLGGRLDHYTILGSIWQK